MTSKKDRAHWESPATELDALIEEAIVDAYDTSEQATSFYTMLENDLALPFKTEVLGMEWVGARGSDRRRGHRGHLPTGQCPAADSDRRRATSGPATEGLEVDRRAGTDGGHVVHGGTHREVTID